MNDWKPGDVAMSDSGVVLRCLFRTARNGTRGGWTYDDGSGMADNHPHNLRPLVVIDPEDSDAVERLWRMAETTPAAFADALREFAAPKPPRPDEPQGLGAVVEALCGCNTEPRRYVRDPDARDFNLPWDAKGVAPGIEVPWVSLCGHHRYADLTDVRVLSEGVRL